MTKTETIETVSIPGGSFLMGSDDYGDTKPVHQVTVAPFDMGKYQITQAQWQAVMGNNPSHFKGDNLPVEQVSWRDALEFCRKLSDQSGKNYRLPTEAEWEHACRAGCDGQQVLSLDDGWFYENSDSKTHPVGEKLPNNWGLHDMHGNVWEWCEDVWHSNYSGAPNDGSAWIDCTSPYRVLRGGSWFNNHVAARSVYRNNLHAVDRGLNSGFRVVVSRPPSELIADGALAPASVAAKPSTVKVAKPSHNTVWEAVDDLHTFYLNAKGTKANLRRLQMLTAIREELESEWPELGARNE